MHYPSPSVARVALLLIALLPLGACRDYSEQIETVQKTTVRHVANNGETRSGPAARTLGEYVVRDVIADSDISWSAEGTTLADGAEGVTVTAAIRPGGPFRLSNKIELNFALDPATGKVAFVGMQNDGEPVVKANGAPYTMYGSRNALFAHWEATAKEKLKKMVQSRGGDPNMIEWKLDAEKRERQ